jgi:transposase
MATIIKKIKNKRPYYYAVESGRVDGKPRIIWQKYLGTLDNILERVIDSPSTPVKSVAIFEAGGVAAMLRIIERIRLIEIIDEVVPKRKQGPSVGQYIAVAIINRILAPCSKLKMPEWYKETVLYRLWNHSTDSFTSQHFWDHMDLITEEHVEEIQKKIAFQVKKEFIINPELLLYDTTNFYTFIATGNKRNTIAKRGRNKAKRNDLRQVGLAMLVTQDFQIPLFHQVYQGNIADQGLFQETAVKIKKHQDVVLGPSSDTTLVFDKGNISNDAMERIIISQQHFVCAVPRTIVIENDLFSTPLENLKPSPELAGTRSFSCDVTLWNKTVKAVLTYSESYFTSQFTELMERLQKCVKSLHDFDQVLLKDKTTEKYSSLKQVELAVKAIASGDYVKEAMDISVKKKNGVFRISYQINQKKLSYLAEHKLGRTLIITSRSNWNESKIISAYRGQNAIENAFKRMKNQEYLHWQPTYHWTDQKIQVHGLYCVLALLVSSLAYKVVVENGIEISFLDMLNELTNIREVALFSSEKPDKRRKEEEDLALSRMTPIQKKLAAATEIGFILSRRQGNTKQKKQNPVQG